MVVHRLSWLHGQDAAPVHGIDCMTSIPHLNVAGTHQWFPGLSVCLLGVLPVSICMTAGSAAAVRLPHHPVTVHRDSTGVDSRIFIGVIITVIIAAAAAAGSDMLATSPAVGIVRMQAGFSCLPR